MPKIGLEVHGYLNTKEKLFCRCDAIYGSKLAKPNVNICPVCTGQPGAKPMSPNKKAIDQTIKIALILDCKINKKLVWQRKHYDWPDLPKGYQNTISGPNVDPVGEKGNFLGIGITQVHLEEDPASWNPKTGKIDYNKSGIPIVEIVTDPDFDNSQQVYDWLKQLVVTLGYIKVMDKNSGIKADVNISLPELKGERVEIKNINSIKNIKTAIDFEVLRQKKPGQLPKRKETRMFEESKGITIKMREKDTEKDYRFIPDPDLPLIDLKDSRIKELEKLIPETPHEKLEKLVKKYKIDKKSAEVLSRKIEIVEFFEKIIQKIDSKLAVRWVVVELLRHLNYNKVNLDDEGVEINEDHFIELLELLEKQRITEQQAKEILNKFIPKSFSPKKELKGKEKITDEDKLEEFIEQVLKENKKAVQDYLGGEESALNFLLGQVMKKSKGRADIKIVKEKLKKKLV